MQIWNPVQCKYPLGNLEPHPMVPDLGSKLAVTLLDRVLYSPRQGSNLCCTGALHGSGFTQYSNVCLHDGGWREDCPIFLGHPANPICLSAPQRLVATAPGSNSTSSGKICCNKWTSTSAGRNSDCLRGSIAGLSCTETVCRRFCGNSSDTSEYPEPSAVVCEYRVYAMSGTTAQETRAHRSSRVWVCVPREHHSLVCSFQSDSGDDWTGDRCTGIVYNHVYS